MTTRPGVNPDTSSAGRTSGPAPSRGSRGLPLTGLRGPARRATVIRDAILGALADGEDVVAALWSVIDLDASEHDPGPAGTFRAAYRAVEDLDSWAINNA